MENISVFKYLSNNTKLFITPNGWKVIAKKNTAHLFDKTLYIATVSKRNSILFMQFIDFKNFSTPTCEGDSLRRCIEIENFSTSQL